MTLLRTKRHPITQLDRTHPLTEGLVCAASLNEPGNASRNLVCGGLLVGTTAPGGLATTILAGHEPWFNGFGSGYSFVLWHSGITLGTWGALLAIGDSTLSWQRYNTENYFKNYHSGTGQLMSNLLLSKVADPSMLVCLWDGSQMRAYVDAVQVGHVSMDPLPKTDSTTSTLYIGGSCTLYQLLIYNRALSATEITRLYREPLALFKETSFWAPVVASGGVTHNLSGSVGATTQLSAAARATRCLLGQAGAVGSLVSAVRVAGALSATSVTQTSLVASLSTSDTVVLVGTASARSGASATLTVMASQSEGASELDWLDEALFFGATASAFQFGTVLSGGWFWMRQTECMALYRGPSAAQVDFDNALTVAHRGDRQIVLPEFLAHEPNASYCYVTRCFNTCGYSERTMAAAVMVRFDAEGRLAAPVPNGVLGLRAERLCGSRVRLVWSYWPLDQQIEPESFCIYTDGGVGQIDFETPLASLPYEGRKFYRYHTDSLSEGIHRFAAIAVRQGQAEPGVLALVRCPIYNRCPEGVTILAAEVMS